MDATQAAQAIQSNLWQELLKLAIFAVFVTSIIEVVKGISAIGIKGIFVDLWKTLIRNTPMQTGSIQTLNFVIALLCCWAFDYGVINGRLPPPMEVFFLRMSSLVIPIQ